MSPGRQDPLPQMTSFPEETLDENKYTKQHLQNAQRPIPSIDLGEEEEILDPVRSGPQMTKTLLDPLR